MFQPSKNAWVIVEYQMYDIRNSAFSLTSMPFLCGGIGTQINDTDMILLGGTTEDGTGVNQLISMRQNPSRI